MSIFKENLTLQDIAAINLRDEVFRTLKSTMTSRFMMLKDMRDNGIEMISDADLSAARFNMEKAETLRMANVADALALASPAPAKEGRDLAMPSTSMPKPVVRNATFVN